MWTVYGSDDRALASPLPTNDDIRPLAQQLIRIKTIGQLLAADETSPTEARRTWKHAWAHRLHQATDLFESQAHQTRLADDPKNDTFSIEAREMRQEARLVEKSLIEQGLLVPRTSYVVGRTDANRPFPHTSQQLASLGLSHAARLLVHSSVQIAFEVPSDQAAPLRDALREASETSNSVWQITTTPPAMTTTDQLWHHSQATRQPAIRMMFKGPHAAVQIHYPYQRWADIPPHAALATLLVALTILTGVLLQRPTVVDAIVVRPHLLGVVAGLLWWLFLSPSVFGWVIVAISLFTSLHVVWPRTVASPSTVTRLGQLNK